MTDNQSAKTLRCPLSVYFVSYVVQLADGGIAYGNAELALFEPLTSMAQVREVEAQLRNDGDQRVIVTGFQLLRYE